MSTGHRVRRATRDDLDALLALEEATFSSDRISRRQWQRHLTSPSATVLAIGTHGAIDAAAVIFHRRNACTARLYSLAVRASARGRGLGAALLVAAEAEALARGCARMSLEVNAGNRSAVALYERHGYARLARLSGFYEDGTDAWRYARNLIRS